MTSSERAWRGLLLLCLFFGVGAPPALASEQSLKLAFVYNFAKFTHWPARSAPGTVGKVTVCVAGDDPDYETALGSLAGRKLGDYPVLGRNIKRASEVADCQVVFVPRGDARFAAEIARSAQSAGVLSVSDDTRFLELGGMIVLVSSESHLRFDVSQATALQAGLSLSSQLLKLARHVRME